MDAYSEAWKMLCASRRLLAPRIDDKVATFCRRNAQAARHAESIACDNEWEAFTRGLDGESDFLRWANIRIELDKIARQNESLILLDKQDGRQ